MNIFNNQTNGVKSYKTYNDFKSFNHIIKDVYVCKSGDSMSGNLDMTCNDIKNVNSLSFCDGTNIGEGNLDISGNLSVNCNLINDVSGINFCDGTYIGQGNSFDICSNQVIKFNENILIIDTCGNVGIGTITPEAKLDVSGNAIISGNVVVGSNSDAYGLITKQRDNIINKTGFYTPSYFNTHTHDINIQKIDISDNLPTTELLLGAHYDGGSDSTTYIQTRDKSYGSVNVPSLSYLRDLYINPLGGNVGIGTTTPQEKLDVSGNVNISGTLNATTKNFKIPHPNPNMRNNFLYHSSVESSVITNIYSGTVTFKNTNIVELNMDTENNMTEGTWIHLNRNPKIFIQNNTTFNRFKAIIKQNKLIIECECETSDKVDWLVIVERCDNTIMKSSNTNNDGTLITERNK